VLAITFGAEGDVRPLAALCGAGHDALAGSETPGGA